MKKASFIRKARHALSACGLLIALGSSPNAWADNSPESEIARISASRATYITSGASFRDYTDQERMIVGFSTNPALRQMRGWVEFDLSHLPPDVVIEGVAMGLPQMEGNQVNPSRIIVSNQVASDLAVGGKVSWDRIGDGGDPEKPVVADLSQARASKAGEMTALETRPEMSEAVKAALKRTPPRLYLLLHSPDAESQEERGHYWRFSARQDLDSRPILLIQYARKEFHPGVRDARNPSSSSP